MLGKRFFLFLNCGFLKSNSLLGVIHYFAEVIKIFFKMKARLIFLWAMVFISPAFGQGRFIIDADTGNEMDDLFAIVRMLVDPNTEVIALNSAHYNNAQITADSIWNENPVTEFNTVKVSQDYNEQLLEGLQMMDIPHPIGANRFLGYTWGYYPGAKLPQSPASDLIISEAKKLADGQRLNIAILGACTNVAAAIAKDTTIANKLNIYMLGAEFNVHTNVWNKNSFNVQNDLNAFDYLMDNEQIQLTIMPGAVIKAFKYKKSVIQPKLYAYHHPTTDLLANIWDDINAAEYRVMWDLGLTAALIRPELATIEERPAPPENKRKTVGVFVDIDMPEMQKDFWESLDQYFKKHQNDHQ